MNGPEESGGMDERDAGLEAFERGLSAALQHVETPPDFVLRVMDKVGLETAARGRVLPWWRERRIPAWSTARPWAAAALAAVLALGVFVGGGIHIARDREHASAADQQFAEAVQATNHALDQTRAQLARAGLPLAE